MNPSATIAATNSGAGRRGRWNRIADALTRTINHATLALAARVTARPASPGNCASAPSVALLATDRLLPAERAWRIFKALESVAPTGTSWAITPCACC